MLPKRHIACTKQIMYKALDIEGINIVNNGKGMEPLNVAYDMTYDTVALGEWFHCFKGLEWHHFLGQAFFLDCLKFKLNALRGTAQSVTQSHISEDTNLQQHHCENFKSQVYDGV